MKEVLNEKQKKILEFVNEQVHEKGYPPSVREICAALDIKSTSTVHKYLAQLDEKGYIRKDGSKPRALKIIDTDYIYDQSYVKDDEGTYVRIPIVGNVTAGRPILAVENINDTFPLPPEYVKGATTFMLSVKGDSMIDAGIFDGDLVIVRKQSNADNGDIVVALIGDEATVKTFYREDEHIRLQPRNKFMDPIILKEGVTILGKVTGLFRSF